MIIQSPNPFAFLDAALKSFHLFLNRESSEVKL